MKINRPKDEKLRKLWHKGNEETPNDDAIIYIGKSEGCYGIGTAFDGILYKVGGEGEVICDLTEVNVWASLREVFDVTHILERQQPKWLSEVIKESEKSFRSYMSMMNKRYDE